MPVYSFLCPQCGKNSDHVLLVAQRQDDQPCPFCGNEFCRRDFAAEHVHSTDQGYQTPILSHSLGVAPNQIAEAQRNFPHHEFAPDGRMILRSHAQRKRVMKDLGFHDKDGYD